MNEPVYWKTKNGRELNVDDMDDNHVRNAFKVLIKKYKYLEEVFERNFQKSLKEDTTLRGDMAQEFNDSYPEDDDFDAYDHGDIGHMY